MSVSNAPELARKIRKSTAAAGIQRSFFFKTTFGFHIFFLTKYVTRLHPLSSEIIEPAEAHGVQPMLETFRRSSPRSTVGGAPRWSRWWLATVRGGSGWASSEVSQNPSNEGTCTGETSIFNDVNRETGETHFYKKDPKTTLRAMMSGGSTGPWASESRMRPGPDLDTWCRHVSILSGTIEWVETQTRTKSWILEGSLPTNRDPTNRDAIYFYCQQLVRLSDQKSPEVSRVHVFGTEMNQRAVFNRRAAVFCRGLWCLALSMAGVWPASCSA